MSFDKIENKECLCAFVNSLGDFATVLKGLLNGMVGLLNLLKATIQLIPLSLDDELKKLQYEIELAALEQAVVTISLPMNLAMAYVRPWADCPPVQNVATVIKNVRDNIVKPIEDKKFEIEQFKAAMDDKKRRVDQINRWITTLNDINDAFDECKDL